MKLLFVYSVDDLFKAFSCTILDLNIFCLNTKKSPYLNIFSKYFFMFAFYRKLTDSFIILQPSNPRADVSGHHKVDRWILRLHRIVNDRSGSGLSTNI